MARLFLTGLETGSLASELTTSPSGFSIDSTIVRSGAKSLKIVAASGVSASAFWLARAHLATPAFERVYLRVTALPATTSRLLFGLNTTNAMWLNLDPSGSLTIRANDGVSTLTAATSATLLNDPTKWYCIQLRNMTNASTITAGVDVLAKVDGEDLVSGLTRGINSYAQGPGLDAGIGPVDSVADTYTVYLDDYVSETATWVGTSNLALLKPVSDNARGGWTAGAGGTTNLFDAVDNTPPVGVAAASETNTSQIKNAVSSTTDNCDFNLQSYTTAGVSAGATIVSAQAFAFHGEEIATGTKAGALKIVSNPAQSVEDTFNFGDDVGADGTFPTNWGLTVGAAQASPTVTLGTQPVIRVGKRTATTRVVNVAFVGLYVEYIPAPTSQTANVGLGQLTLTGQAPTVVLGIKAYVGVGALSLTGLSPTPVINMRAQTDIGALVLTGLAPIPTSTNNQSAVVGLGSLVLTGLVPSISQSANQRALTDIGSLLLTGFSPTPTSSDNKTAATDVGALILAGLAPSAQLGMRALTDVGALVLAGLSPTAVVSNNQYALTDLGALILSGLSPTPVSTDNNQALTDLGSLILAGLSPSAVVGFRAYPDVGALTLTGFAPTPNSTQSALTQTGQLILSGLAPSAVAGGNNFALTDVGQLILSGLSPTVLQTDNKRALTDLGALILSGLAPTILQTSNQQALTDAGSLLLAGFSPSVVVGSRAYPDVGALTLTGFAPTSNSTQSALTQTGQLILGGFTPSAVVSDNIRALTDLGQLLLTGFSPSVLQTDNQMALTALGALVLSGFAPSVAQTNNQFVIPGVGQLILTGLAPSIVQTNNKFALTDVAILIIDGFAPMVVIASIEDPSLSYGGQFYPSSDYY